uniref:Putative conserved secreted protein n=1 Tax=Haematobia irritans TaxID=7368 RepID=A0A1L8EAY7_HAEIR
MKYQLFLVSFIMIYSLVQFTQGFPLIEDQSMIPTKDTKGKEIIQVDPFTEDPLMQPSKDIKDNEITSQCLVNGSKCYSHQACCSKRCHTYAKKCVI